MNTVEMLFGAVLIWIYATERFNTPRTTRASTTAGRYYAAAAIYLLIYLVTFSVFAKNPMLVGLFPVPASTEINSSDSKVVMAAVLLSLLVPKVPVISEIDTRLRGFLHRLAAIPYEAIRLSQEIQSSQYKVPAAVWDSVTDELMGQGFPAEGMESDDPVIRGWIKSASLMTQLTMWMRSHQFGIFMHERSDQFERINEHYARVKRMALSAAALNQQASAQPQAQPLQDAAKAFRHNLQGEQRALLSSVCDFISHGVLQTCFSNGARRRTLAEMGFLDAGKGENPGLSVNQTVTLFGLFIALMLGNYFMYQFRAPNAQGEQELLKHVMIGSIYGAAVLCAVVPRRHWSFFRVEQAGTYPSAGYLLSGVTAVIVSGVISLVFNTLIFAAHDEVSGFADPFIMAWTRLSTQSYPWLTMAFVAAISTSFLIDWRWPASLRARMKRVADGVFQAWLLMAAAALVYWWISGLPGARAPDLHQVLRTTAILGFTMGFIVPTWYRASPEKPPFTGERPTSGERGAAAQITLRDVQVITPLRGPH